jgi:protein phosphatase
MPVFFSAQSHAGVCRPANEDSFCARPDLGLFVVADGLGGHVAGHLASSLAVEAFQAVVGGGLGIDDRVHLGVESGAVDPAERLHAAFSLASRRLGLRVSDNARLRGMGTTVAALLLSPDDSKGSTVDSATGLEWAADTEGAGDRAAVVAHVGDSRIYRLSAGRLERLTEDHSWVDEQVRAGVLTPAEARKHPWRNLVTRALTGESEPEPDIERIALSRGDRVLLCTDGLFTVLSDEEIEDVLGQQLREVGAAAAERTGPGLDLICEQLIVAANLAGGPDNITVIVVDV